MTKNCWNSQALAEISCYLAFAGAMLYLVRSGRYLSYVTPKLAPYLCFSAAVMVVWALSSLGRMFRIQYRKHIAHCFVLAIPLLLLLLPHDTVGLRDISDSAGLLNGSMVSGAAGRGRRHTRPPEAPYRPIRRILRRRGPPRQRHPQTAIRPWMPMAPPLSSTDITPGSKPSQSAMRSSTTGCAYFIQT